MMKDQIINSNKEATRWLGVWLDATLSFRTHKDVYLNKARKAEACLRSNVNRKGLAPGLARKIQIAAVQAASLFGVELWWRGQKSWMKEYQLLINRQGRIVTGMFRPAPAGLVVKEAGLRPAISLLNNRQRRYT